MKRSLVLLPLVLVLSFGAARAEEGRSWETVLAEGAEPVVFLRFVLKVQVTMGAQTQEQERNMEVSGVVVSEGGLVMTSHSHFDPSGGLPPGMRDRVQLKATPADLKVLFGNEEDEYDAQLAAVDSVLGLAYVQILDLKERKPKWVDLTPGPAPVLNGELVGIGRLPREFDCAPVLGRLYVRGKVEKPREMWLVSGEGATPGLPVYELAGRPVGVVALQRGSAGVEGGGGNRPFLLPLATVERSLKAAAEKAAELLAKPAGEEKEPEEGAKPADEGSKPAEEQTPPGGAEGED